MQSIKGQYVDILNRRTYPAKIEIKDKKIRAITPIESAPQHYILPGFIDAHIHIESSMLTPAQFAREAVKHGTVATVSDPHEIANVCGLKGVEFMLENAGKVPLKFHFGAPSCVPATPFETAGAVLDAGDIALLMARSDIYYLSEVMNFPAVIAEDPEMMQKLEAAIHFQKPIDGHAPGMEKSDMHKYFSKGISTDHECVSLMEAEDKIAHDCKILIREGSAAKNFEALVDLFFRHPSSLMLCSDDLHPDDLLKGHINLLVKRCLEKGVDLYDALYAACVHPVLHYTLPVGLLRVGDAADFIIMQDFDRCEVQETWINGECIYTEGEVLFDVPQAVPINHFNCQFKNPEDFEWRVNDTITSVNVRVIDALDGQLITQKSSARLSVQNGVVLPDVPNDILKIAVVNRYQDAPVSLGFIRNIGLQNAAIASTVAHDSHNIVVVGTDDILICKAVNALIETKGGICYVDTHAADVLPLPIAGLMTDTPAAAAGKQYQQLTQQAKQAGSKLKAPFMTLSFMALPVIPFLKITDKGLFDVSDFGFTDLMMS